MKKRRIALIIVIFILMVMLVACGNSSNQSKTDGHNQSNSENTNEISDQGEATETESNDDNIHIEQHESANEGASNQLPQEKQQEEQDVSSTDTSTNLKETYLHKLHDTNDRTEKMETTDSSTFALKDVAHTQYEEWDDLLNEIYGVLEEQLSAGEMDQLREEQRDWITDRDESAKEASLQYEGGTLEQLEYVTVLADITKERCYELVEGYMK